MKWGQQQTAELPTLPLPQQPELSSTWYLLGPKVLGLCFCFTGWHCSYGVTLSESPGGQGPCHSSPSCYSAFRASLVPMTYDCCNKLLQTCDLK